MKSCERLKSAISKKLPDRVPLDLGSSITGLTLFAAKKLCNLLGIKEDLKIIVKPLQLIEPPEEILIRLHIDTRYVRPTLPNQETFEEEYIDEWGIRWRLASNGFYYDIVEHPLKEGTLEEIEKFDWPEPRQKELFSGLRERCEYLHRHTDYAIIGDPLSPALFEPAWYLRGMENFLVDLIQNRKYAERLLDTLLEFKIQFFDEFLKQAGDYIQVIMLGDDLGTQKAPLLSPKLYQEVVKPRHKNLFSFIKSRTEAKIFLHSCGAIEPLIPQLIDAGVEILHPLQPLAHGMNHQKIKEKYGDKLCFWGGIDIQSALPGSKEEVRLEVERRIKLLGKNGGYVMSPAHNIQPDTPPENILEMFDYALEVGKYQEERE
ncbi:uroporphyrinogen decarboxylase family protein [Thermatribacter velox]|uniref:Uroporphyrinogen decarboxylase family protein n=1 Tax=Thermatribacter velox TaxID=3039681 RepID=A0ABZ2Y908_9BACT